MIKLEFNPPTINEVNDEEVSPDIISKKRLKKKPPSAIYDKKNLTQEDYNRIVEMAWQDRTHFDVIYRQYGLTENEVKKLMRTLLSAKAFKRWRKRVQERKTKHLKQCRHKPTRFEGPW